MHCTWLREHWVQHILCIGHGRMSGANKGKAWSWTVPLINGKWTPHCHRQWTRAPVVCRPQSSVKFLKPWWNTNEQYFRWWVHWVPCTLIATRPGLLNCSVPEFHMSEMRQETLCATTDPQCYDDHPKWRSGWDLLSHPVFGIKGTKKKQRTKDWSESFLDRVVLVHQHTVTWEHGTRVGQYITQKKNRTKHCLPWTLFKIVDDGRVAIKTRPVVLHKLCQYWTHCLFPIRGTATNCVGWSYAPLEWECRERVHLYYNGSTVPLFCSVPGSIKAWRAVLVMKTVFRAHCCFFGRCAYYVIYIHVWDVHGCDYLPANVYKKRPTPVEPEPDRIDPTQHLIGCPVRLHVEQNVRVVCGFWLSSIRNISRCRDCWNKYIHHTSL